MPSRCAPRSSGYAAAHRLLAAVLASFALWLGAATSARAADSIRVAILPFQVTKEAATLELYGTGLRESLETALANTPPFVLPQPKRLQHVLRGLKSGPPDTETAVKIAREVGAQVLLMGSLSANSDGNIRLTARYLDAAANEARSLPAVSGPLDQLFDLQVELAHKWIDAMGVVITQEQWNRLEGAIKSSTVRNAYDFYLQGRAAQLKGHMAGWAEAINWYRKAVAADNHYALAYARLAEALSQLGQEKGRRGEDAAETYSQAIEGAQRAIDLAPDMLEGRRTLGLLYLVTGKMDLAAAELRRVLQLHYNDPETWYLLWRTLDGDVPESANVQEALILDPSFIPALRDLGIHHYERGQYDQAIHYFQRILAIAPEEPSAHYNLGLAYRRKNLLDKAQVEYQSAVHYAADFADASYALGMLFLQRGLPDDAVNAFRAAISANPRHANAHFYLGGLYLKKGQLDASLAAFQKAAELNPRDADAPLNAGNVYLEMGKLELALGNYQRAAQLRPDYANAYYNLGLVLGRLGRNQEAQDAYERYLQYAPRAADARKVKDLIRKLKELH